MGKLLRGGNLIQSNFLIFCIYTSPRWLLFANSSRRGGHFKRFYLEALRKFLTWLEEWSGYIGLFWTFFMKPKSVGSPRGEISYSPFLWVVFGLPFLSQFVVFLVGKERPGHSMYPRLEEFAKWQGESCSPG